MERSSVAGRDHVGEALDDPDQGKIEQYLREKLRIQSRSTDYHDDSDQIQMTFAIPGSRTVVTINRADGRGEVESESRGLLGKLGDLHKGFDTGKVWYWTIDVAAGLLIISSLTGMVTLLASTSAAPGTALCTRPLDSPSYLRDLGSPV
jgi:hypothetical protein